MKTCLAAKGNILFVELSFISDRFTRHFNFTPYLSKNWKSAGAGCCWEMFPMFYWSCSSCSPRKGTRDMEMSWKIAMWFISVTECRVPGNFEYFFRDPGNWNKTFRDPGNWKNIFRDPGNMDETFREFRELDPPIPPTVECYFHRDISWREKFITIR